VDEKLKLIDEGGKWVRMHFQPEAGKFLWVDAVISASNDPEKTARQNLQMHKPEFLRLLHEAISALESYQGAPAS
jgi:hypothetical protein